MCTKKYVYVTIYVWEIRMEDYKRFVDYLRDYLVENNISNVDFSNRIGITPKHFGQILSKEVELSNTIIDSIAIVMNIDIEAIYRKEFDYKFSKSIEEYLSEKGLSKKEFLKDVNFEYLKSNEWINFKDEKDELECIKDILKFLRIKSLSHIDNIDLNISNELRIDDKLLIYLWLEKCYKDTLKQDIVKYDKEYVDVLISYVKQKGFNNELDKEEMISKFNSNGIGLVFENRVSNSNIKASFKVHKDTPVIYISNNHSTICDVYYSVLYMLSHCRSDFNKAKSMHLILHDNIIPNLKSEFKANHFMINNNYYNKIIKDDNYDIEKEVKYPKSFVSYRMLKDRIITLNSKEYIKNNVDYVD